MLSRVFKNIVFWSYGRTTWQYDVLCVLILAFVFLTPKSWFEQGELNRKVLHQNGSITAHRLLVGAENLGPNPGAQEIERGVQNVTGRSGVRVRNWRALKGDDGRVVAYEVDIE